MAEENVKKSYNFPKITITTGNILSVIKKAGQKPAEELIDCLRTTLQEVKVDPDRQIISRSFDDIHERINEHERNSIKIGAKVFLNNDSVEYIEEAVNATLQILGISFLDNLILAYHPKHDSEEVRINAGNNMVVTPQQEENQQQQQQQTQKEGVIEWGGKDPKSLSNLKRLWSKLEEFSKNKMICQLGISDLDVDTLKDLHESSKVNPTIVQINLSACCVVPPALQEFCNSNEIQLLTHSDPEILLGKNTLKDIGLQAYVPKWTIRYTVHVKCRGLLTAKGYLVGANLASTVPI